MVDTPLTLQKEQCHLKEKRLYQMYLCQIRLVQVVQNLTIVGELKHLKTLQLLQLTTKVLTWLLPKRTLKQQEGKYDIFRKSVYGISNNGFLNDNRCC